MPGDVIVAAAGGYLTAAVTGDLLAGMARNCGVAAIVTDGTVRDMAGILDVGLPVYCAAFQANSPARNGPGTVGLPVIVGGVAVDAETSWLAMLTASSRSQGSWPPSGRKADRSARGGKIPRGKSKGRFADSRFCADTLAFRSN